MYSLIFIKWRSYERNGCAIFVSLVLIFMWISVDIIRLISLFLLVFLNTIFFLGIGLVIDFSPVLHR